MRNLFSVLPAFDIAFSLPLVSFEQEILSSNKTFYNIVYLSKFASLDGFNFIYTKHTMSFGKDLCQDQIKKRQI